MSTIVGLPVPSHAVTLQPQWAFAFTHLGKRVENRTWTLPEKWIGSALCLHAGSSIAGTQVRAAAEQALEVFFEQAGAAGWGLEHEIVVTPEGVRLYLRGSHEDGRVLPRTLVPSRAIVGVAIFDRVEQLAPVPAVRPGDPWAVGPFAWRARRMVPLQEPVACKEGKLGLWPISAGRFQQLRLRLGDAVVAQTE